MNGNEALGDLSDPDLATPPIERVATTVFSVLVVLRPTGAHDEVAAEIGDQLRDLQLKISRHQSLTVLQLTVPATDLWLAVLHAMAAVTRLGYTARSVQAAPAAPC